MRYISKGAWLRRITWVAWSRLLVRRIARAAWNRLLVGRISLTLTRVAFGRLLRVTLRRIPLLWRRLVVLLLRVTLCLRRLLISVGIVTHGHWCVGLVGHGHSRLGRVGQGSRSSSIRVGGSSCGCRWGGGRLCRACRHRWWGWSRWWIVLSWWAAWVVVGWGCRWGIQTHRCHAVDICHVSLNI